MTATPVPAELLEARKEIDRIDQALIDLLVERFSWTHRVGLVKATHGLEAVDAEREAQKLARIREQCQEQGVNPDLVVELFTRIMEEVVRNHRQLANKP
jgi:chorismate mutase